MSDSRPRPRLLALLIIAVGLVWLLNNLGFTQVELGDILSAYWPLLLVVWGIDILAGSVSEKDGRKTAGTGGLITGVILSGLGLAILTRNLGYFNFDFSQLWGVFWAVLLILLGVAILRRPSTGPGGNHFAFMSGLEMRNPGWNLSDDSWMAIMGGVDLDLTVAAIPPGEVFLNLTAVMGGIDIRIPRGLGLDCRGAAILGGIDFPGQDDGGIIVTNHIKRPPDSANGSTLVINALAILGGIEIKE